MNSALGITLHGIYIDENSLTDYEILARPYFISEDIFKSIVELMSKQKSCTAANFMQQSAGNWTILTFDDGLKSDYDRVFPLLVENNLTATFFITVKNIGKKNYCSATELREMNAAGMEIGSHGLTHEYLITKNKKEVISEISDSRSELEQILGTPVISFAPVGGHYRSWIIEVVRAEEYKIFSTMIPGLTLHDSNFLMLHRNHIQSFHDLSYIIRLLDRNPQLLQMNYFKYQFLRFFKRFLGINHYDYLKEKLFN
jgi:peptidoglycan/xylan/chitin deacetylase (PgdA/CDA1 family)